MGPLSGFDWGAALLPDRPVLEIAVRGTLVYLGAPARLPLPPVRSADQAAAAAAGEGG